ncbi:MAG: cyclic pyranopterin monophosphate synthase MoaC [Acidobacteriia bacterium]|nr:cyclic pyranopterin monophosphate synthase MoaC [Terriglobia bacterium]
MARLTHVDARGEARMVDVGGKRVTRRRAVARGRLALGAKAFRLLAGNRLAKGDALAVARIAGIAAGKRASEWIPLCHTVPLDHLDVAIDLDAGNREAVVTATVEARWVTGVEMEALVAVSGACLVLYDMTKGVDRASAIREIVLLEKSGGRSGRFKRGATRGSLT